MQQWRRSGVLAEPDRPHESSPVPVRPGSRPPRPQPHRDRQGALHLAARRLQGDPRARGRTRRRHLRAPRQAPAPRHRARARGAEVDRGRSCARSATSSASARSISQQDAGTLSIATTHSQARYFLPEPIGQLQEALPEGQRSACTRVRRIRSARMVIGGGRRDRPRDRVARRLRRPRDAAVLRMAARAGDAGRRTRWRSSSASRSRTWRSSRWCRTTRRSAAARASTRPSRRASSSPTSCSRRSTPTSSRPTCALGLGVGIVAEMAVRDEPAGGELVCASGRPPVRPERHAHRLQARRLPAQLRLRLRRDDVRPPEPRAGHARDGRRRRRTTSSEPADMTPMNPPRRAPRPPPPACRVSARRSSP